jgi:hypothetical protein
MHPFDEGDTAPDICASTGPQACKIVFNQWQPVDTVLWAYITVVGYMLSDTFVCVVLYLTELSPVGYAGSMCHAGGAKIPQLPYILPRENK